VGLWFTGEGGWNPIPVALGLVEDEAMDTFFPYVLRKHH